MQGLIGTQDALPISFEEWEQRAREVLEPGPFGYVAGGAGAEDTMRANCEAFYRWRIRPRLLRDVSDRDLTVTLFGTTLPAPFLLAPVGVQSIIHPDADRAPARAATRTGIPLVLSTVSSVTIEGVAATMGDAPRWFQLYPGRDRAVIASMLKRAERAGYSAVVVTLDTPILGWRERDLRLAYLPFLQGQGLANYLSDPVFRSRLAVPPEENMQAAIMDWLFIVGDPALTWSDLELMRAQTRLPLLLKGITHPDDARLALEHGVDGLIVSTHGGRQVDGAVAALDALPAVCDAVQGKIPVLMDSGIRRGADVVKAIALGARAVLLGRPYLYAMAVAGEAGVEQVIRNLMAEIDLQLALSGCRSVQEADRSLVENVQLS
jgi:lactate 2-monooxygenase